jgi:membrane-associated phospholipid phosphatase
MNALKIKIEYDRRIHLEEILCAALVGILNLLLVIYSDVRKAPWLFSINTAFFAFILTMPYIHGRCRGTWCDMVRDFHVVIIAAFLFFEHHHLVPLINPHDVDGLLVQIDRYLFLGNDPTVLLESITFPALTELLQIAYTSYYALPVALGGLIYARGEKITFHIVAPTILLGLYLCYLGYYLTPAIGPRFTLDHLQTFPLQGVFSYDFIRTGLDTIEGITRDCCPSGHTLVSVLTASLAYRYYRPFFRIASVWAALIVVSTVYLRYHYVADLVAALIILLPVYMFTPLLAQKYIHLHRRTRKGIVADEAETPAS